MTDEERTRRSDSSLDVSMEETETSSEVPKHPLLISALIPHFRRYKIIQINGVYVAQGRWKHLCFSVFV